MRGLAGWIVNIAGVDITKTCVHGDPPRHVQRLRRCRRPVHQLPVRMEGREVQRHVGAEPTAAARRSNCSAAKKQPRPGWRCRG